MDKAREVPRWRESDVFTPLEREVMEYAEAMTPDAAHRDRRDGRAPAGQLGAAALVELTAVIGFANMHDALERRARHRVGGLRGGVRAQAAGGALRRTLDGMSRDPFVTHRSLLFTVAYEMLGSAADAEDVVQETWLRWADIGDDARAEVRDPRAYLVRIVTRQALNRLRTLARRARTTSASGCPSRCSRARTSPRTSSSPRASRSRCSPCSRR